MPENDGILVERRGVPHERRQSDLFELIRANRRVIAEAQVERDRIRLLRERSDAEIEPAVRRLRKVGLVR